MVLFALVATSWTVGGSAQASGDEPPGGIGDAAILLDEISASPVLAAIPREAYLAYLHAAEAWDVDWALLAAIGEIECRHGQYEGAGCPTSTMNEFGARGYMQFIGSTWRTSLGDRKLEARTSTPAADGFGFATDGDGDGDADPWSWPDATHSAARYLSALGVNDDPETAIGRYNRSGVYVSTVLTRATIFRNARNSLRPD